VGKLEQAGGVERPAAVNKPGAASGIAGATSGPEEQFEQSPQKKPGHRERRWESRQEVDTSAEILLVNVGSRLRGRILDLSVGGCRIHTDDRFPVGIYTRVETEFRLDGLSFRLGGVVQHIHDRKTVGIRFLDLSERKRQQVRDLIAEIAEAHMTRKPVDPAAA
jgi:hypothetical protein